MLRDMTSAAGDETQSLPLIARVQYKSTMIKDLKNTNSVIRNAAGCDDT